MPPASNTWMQHVSLRPVSQQYFAEQDGNKQIRFACYSPFAFASAGFDLHTPNKKEAPPSMTQASNPAGEKHVRVTLRAIKKSGVVPEILELSP